MQPLIYTLGNCASDKHSHLKINRKGWDSNVIVFVNDYVQSYNDTLSYYTKFWYDVPPYIPVLRETTL